MLIIRSPLRITLGGGGTDLRSYYEKKGGFLLAATINKYVYVTITKPFIKGIYLKYSKIENNKNFKSINHPIIKEVFKNYFKKENQIEITTLADIPAGTGLGSSGSFTTALIKALYTHHKKNTTQEQIAQKACEIEIEKLKEPIGKQDQYIAAYGGIKSFEFKKNGKVEVNNLNLKNSMINKLEDNIIIFFTGYQRSASKLLKTQDTKSKLNQKEMIKNLDYIKKLGVKGKRFLEKNDFTSYGELMNEHWEFKKKRSKNMSNDTINDLYNYAIKNGALGGKLIGAGGGGFLMFCAQNREKLIHSMEKKGFLPLRYKFSYEGTEVINNN